MTQFEYTVVPAPKRTKRIKGVRGQEARFAAIFAEVINEQAANGWEYMRTESLPVEEKRGLFGSRREACHNILIFRRVSGVEAGFVDADVAAPAEAQGWIPNEPSLGAPVMDEAPVEIPMTAPMEEGPLEEPAMMEEVAETTLDELPPTSARPAD